MRMVAIALTAAAMLAVLTGCTSETAPDARTSASVGRDETPPDCAQFLDGKGYAGLRLIDVQSFGFTATLCTLVPADRDLAAVSVEKPVAILGVVVLDGQHRIVEHLPRVGTEPLGGDPGRDGPVLR